MNKTVLVTGGAHGLGFEIAKCFASHGYKIILTYFSNEELAKEAKEYLMNTYKVDVSIAHLDVQDEENIEELMDSIDTLDCLVNNAAYNNDCDVFDKTKAEFMHTLDVNLIGPFLMCKYAYDLLNESHGSIVNVASTNGIDTMYPESLDYDASKAALINMTKNLAKSFKDVRVNAIAPGWIETESTEDMSLDFRGQELSHIVINRFAEPLEIAKVVYFVGSDDASYMTGSVVRVDGGLK